ncbi:type II toxin-antitoxin system RatA family toxin [Gallaecimonas kandeliae]|uniref:type II toxin-antitoxin system RatA family toxin n=1 Tax=Gallaecimonas kandeliae TaxID=3029055 RepID=UPI002648AF25|nr:type II toxin-antitoxin system RatA family toxin [Gallaecimonas kandeliae]WKE67437.1 type II toxin-antitoxin system RatA family toxin [Gallaecimonas kandeliae]
MPRIERQAEVPFAPQAMFDLVNDVPSYPAFLPGCVAARVLSKGEGSMTATLDVAKGPVRKSFTTRNTLFAPDKIRMELVNGPFRYLHGHWHFLETESGGCQVQLHLDFEFSSTLVAIAFGGIFQQLTHAMVNAFCQRAREVYRD